MAAHVTDNSGKPFMRRALALAKRGLGRVEPNPMVGVVLERDGEVVGEGFHRKFGGPHAEVEAIERMRGSGQDPSRCGLYVTLEPCCHHGKTPPCVEAVIDAGIRRVVVAMRDPNPAVSGKGIAALRDAGIELDMGLCQAQAYALNEPYIKRIKTGLPWVIGKWAQTIDGKIATRQGDSRWISNAASRKRVHHLRARVDAVVVGIGTVLKDNPRLTPRNVPVKRVARKVVVDPDLSIPVESVLFKPEECDGPTAVTLAVRDRVYQEWSDRMVMLQDRGVEFIPLPTLQPLSHYLDLNPLMRHLVEAHNATNVLVEGGGKLMGSLLHQQLLDQLLVFVAPKLMADAAAVPALQGLGPIDVANATPLTLQSVQKLREDIVLDYRT